MDGATREAGGALILRYAGRHVHATTLRKITILSLLRPLDPRPPTNPILGEHLQPRLQLRLMQLKIIRRANPSNTDAGKALRAMSITISGCLRWHKRACLIKGTLIGRAEVRKESCILIHCFNVQSAP